MKSSIAITRRYINVENPVNVFLNLVYSITFKTSLDDARFRPSCIVNETKLCIAPFLNIDLARSCQADLEETRHPPNRSSSIAFVCVQQITMVTNVNIKMNGLV